MVAPVKHLFRTRMQPETIALGIDLVVAPLLGPCWAYLDPCANCTATVGYHSHYYDIEALVWHLGLASLLATTLAIAGCRARPRRWVPPMLWALFNMAQCVFTLRNDFWRLPELIP